MLINACWFVDNGIVSVWPQAVAEAIVVNHMIQTEAGVDKNVPVFAGDLNTHIIVHYVDKKMIHVAKSSSEAEDDKRIAVGCMRELLSKGLGTSASAPPGKHTAHCHTDVWCLSHFLRIAILLCVVCKCLFAACEHFDVQMKKWRIQTSLDQAVLVLAPLHLVDRAPLACRRGRADAMGALELM